MKVRYKQLQKRLVEINSQPKMKTRRRRINVNGIHLRIKQQQLPSGKWGVIK